MGSSSPNRDENKTYLSCHHLENIFLPPNGGEKMGDESPGVKNLSKITKKNNKSKLAMAVNCELPFLSKVRMYLAKL